MGNKKEDSSEFYLTFVKRINFKQKILSILAILGCFKSSWPRIKFVLFQQLGMKIFPPSNLPWLCSDKAPASWSQGRGFKSQFGSKLANLEPLGNLEPNWLQAGFESVTMCPRSRCFVTAPPRQV